MSVALFVENLGAFTPTKCRALNARLVSDGLEPIEAVYAIVWPDYKPGDPPRPQDNREAFAAWRNAAGVPVWAWIRCYGDQDADAQAIEQLEAELDPDGWLLNIEKELQQKKLAVVAKAAAATGKPRSASLSGFSPAGVEYDYRELEKQGFDVDWQCYPDTGEGPFPETAITELHKSSFVLSGWQYRHRIGHKYGWGKVTKVVDDELAHFDSFLIPPRDRGDCVFGVLERGGWGHEVDDRNLFPVDPAKPAFGLLMGRFPYNRTRFTLDIASDDGNAVTLAELERRTAAGRSAGARKRPVSVYLAERDSERFDRIRAIARGAAS